MESENAKSIHEAEIRDMTFRLSDAERRAREAEQMKPPALPDFPMILQLPVRC